MTHRNIYGVNNNQLIIALPSSFKNKEWVLVRLHDNVTTFEEKRVLLKQASKDKLFLADLEEIKIDLDLIDDAIVWHKKKWSIYRANLDPIVGSEQEKSRPELLLS